MLQTLINAFKVKDIRAKVWKMLLLLLIFRIGCYIPCLLYTSDAADE